MEIRFWEPGHDKNQCYVHVDHRTLADLTRLRVIMDGQGRTEMEFIDHPPWGRCECSWCKKDMGPRMGIDPGETTHGICPECSKALRDKHGL